MSTTATTAPAPLTILSKPLLSMSLSFAPGALLHGVRCEHGRPGAQQLLGPKDPSSPGTSGTGRTPEGGPEPKQLRLRSAHVWEGRPRRRGSPPDRGRDGPRLGALARRGAPADHRARGGTHGRALRSARRA